MVGIPPQIGPHRHASIGIVMQMRIAIAGASGYVGGELLRILSGDSSITLGALTADTHVDASVTDLHPHLPELRDHIFVETSTQALTGHDVVFLALPHGHSAELAAQLPQDTVIIDCGADHRLTDAGAWQRYYDTEYAGHWPYGLPELPGARTELAGARRIAVPGCYPTAATLAIFPLLAAGLVCPDVVVVAASGTSGAGRSTASHLTSAQVMGTMTAYGVGGIHRHTPEIVQNLALALRYHAPTGPDEVRVSFTPMLAPMPRGILATVSAPIASAGVTSSDVLNSLIGAYKDEPFVVTLPEGSWPNTGAVLGSNTVHVQSTVDEISGRVVAVAALDNLVKGAAGQAIQCMNIALGRPETTALISTGLAP